MRFVGLNLTVPHKLLALDLVDVLDESARVWGAVNTIRFEARDDAGRWQPLPLLPEAVSGPVRIVSGKSSSWISPPVRRATARSMALRSSRTFPFHS